MVHDTGTHTETAGDGARVAKDTGNETDKTGNEKDKTGDTKEPKDKTRSVSFNRDVHVKRFGNPRESRGSSAEPSIRKESFTHLSEQELIDEANKVLEQAGNITCTSDHPPEKFYSLPHRRKHREDKDRRNSDDGGTPDGKGKSPLGRSTSDASSRKGRERTSLSTLFRRAQKTKPNAPSPVVVTTKPVVVVKRSKSDVSDLKSNTSLNTTVKPIRKRSGSESEEFLKSLRNKKAQLSPIIESSPRDDYFKRTPPLETFQKERLAQKEVIKSEEEKPVPLETKKVNPIEKPPRYKSPDKVVPKPPIRIKRGKSAEKDKESSPTITDTPKRKTEIKKSLLVDEIDSFKAKDLNPIDVKERIKDSIRKLEENIYGDKDMIHSSQQPPDKPPLTRGHTVDHIVRKLKEDSRSPPPRSHLISPHNGSNVNQPFSYTKPSVSPDPNLFVRTTSPDRIPSPVNKMNDKGVVYAHVVRDLENGSSNHAKQTVHKTYSPPKEKYGHISDEDEGLGYEDRPKYSATKYQYDYKKNNHSNFSSLEGPVITDSPIKPRFREYKLTSFDDFEPTYANEYPPMKDPTHDYIETFRGRGDGMDTKKKVVENDRADLDFNELSHRRQLLESRLNARRFDRIPPGEPVSRYLAETDPIYEAEKRMKATEKYVNETAKYIHHTLERDGFAESNVTEDYDRYDSDNHRVKYNTQTRTYERIPNGEVDRRKYLDTLEPRYKDGHKDFPPEPEYEPPSLESIGKPILTPDEYVEKKYRVKKFTSSHDVQRYKGRETRDDYFGKRKGHYASNPEIAQEREDDYANIRNDAKQAESYHNSLRRVKNKDKYKQDYRVRRHDSGDSQDYYRDNTPRRFDVDNRLVDSGIENDFRKSSGEIHRRKKYESEEDVRNTSLLLQSERRHTEDNYPSEQTYANGEYVARFKDKDDGYKGSIERSGDSKGDRYKSPSNEKVSAKPPKAKKLSGLEKVKQLFSRDSSKKSKKEKEVQPTRTRVLKSPEHLARDDSEYKRYTDPEPSDVDTIKKGYDPKEERRYRSSREDIDRYRSSGEDIRKSSGEDIADPHRTSREDINRHRSSRQDIDRHRSSRENLVKHRDSRENLDRYRNSKEDIRQKSSDPRDSDVERKYRVADFDRRYERTLKEDRRYVSRQDAARRYNSSDRESDHLRPSDTDSERRKTRSRTAGPLDSPALAQRYRERRRLATPSPTPSPPHHSPAVTTTATTAGNWFKSLDRLTRKKKKDTKIDKESVLIDNESTRKPWSKPTKTLNSPAKNLRFFGDTDQDSDANVQVPKTAHKPHATLRKTVSNSSTGVDETDHELTSKSYSLTNLHKDESPRTKYYKRNLQNISEIQSNSETGSQLDRRASKPPINPYDRSRSQSSSKTLKGSKSDLRRHRHEDRGSSSELRGSKLDLKPRRRAPAANSGESSTEGDSSHQSQRSVVYLHATTVGDIPDPGRVSRNRSRDDVSSVNSSTLQVRNTTRTFSLFAPWTPRLHPDHRDVHYAQRRKPKEPFKSSSTRNLAEDRPTLQKNKSYSQTTLTRKPQTTRLTGSSTTLYRKPDIKPRGPSSVQSGISRTTRERERERDNKNSHSSSEQSREGQRDRISRSISMPKDKGKKAGWFNLTANKNKKQENTRVR